MKLKWRDQYIKSFSLTDYEFTLGTYESQQPSIMIPEATHTGLEMKNKHT